MALIEKLNAIGDAIREKTGGTDKLTLDGMVEAIAEIQTGAGGGDAIKAFVKNPIGAEPLVKTIVPMPAEFEVSHAYTDVADELKVGIRNAAEGDTLVAAFAVRQEDKPSIPQGWTEVAWLPYVDTGSAKQNLLVLSRITSAEYAGQSSIVSLSGLSQGSRHYGLVLNLRDSCLVESEQYTVSQAQVSQVSVPLYEHTLLICSSTTTTSLTSGGRDNYDPAWAPWSEPNGLYRRNYAPIYADNCVPGGRLMASLLPYREHQPSETYYGQVTYSGGVSSGVLICALGLRLGTTHGYGCTLDLVDT